MYPVFQSMARKAAKGFTIIEVLVALVLFGAGSTVLTFSFGNAVLALRDPEKNNHWEADLQFVRRQVLMTKDIDDLEDGDEIDSLSSGEISWKGTAEMAKVIDLFKVTVEYEIEDASEAKKHHTEVLYLLRPEWSKGEFAGDRETLLQDKRESLRSARQAAGMMNMP